MLSGNPVFSVSSGCPITDFGHDKKTAGYTQTLITLKLLNLRIYIKMKLRELAELTGGRISGNPDVEITGVSGIKEAQEGDITFLTDKKKLK